MCSDDDIDFLLQSGGQPSPSQAPDVVPTSLGFHKPMPKSKHWTVEMVYTTSEEEETGPHPSPHALVEVSGMDAHFSKCGVSVCMCIVGVTM